MSKMKIRADLFFATFGEVSQKVMGYLVLVLLGRYLDKGSMGQFFVAATIAMIAAAVTELGTGRHLIREIATTPQHALRHLGDVLSLRLPLTAGALILVNAAVHLVDPALGSVMLLTSCYVLVGDLYFSYSAFMVGRRLLGLRLATLLGGQLLLALCVGASVLAGGSLRSVLLGYIAANVVTLGLTAALVHSRFGAVRLTRPTGKTWRLARGAAPFGALAALGLLHSKADTLMLYALSSATVVATYESAYKLLEVSRFLIRPAVTVFFPICAALAARGKWEEFNNAYRRLLAAAGSAGAVVAALVISLAGFVIPLVWGSRYLEAVPVLRILYLAVPVLYLQTVVLFIAGSLHLEGTALRATLVALASNVTLNLVAIPRWGAPGAAAATLVTESALTGWLLFITWQRLRAALRRSDATGQEHSLADVAAA
jgi:O-antigen/teichoic acid export membrane protein